MISVTLDRTGFYIQILHREFIVLFKFDQLHPRLLGAEMEVEILEKGKYLSIVLLIV